MTQEHSDNTREGELIMKKFSLPHAQAKRTKALRDDKHTEYWLYDAMICYHLGLEKLALDSLAQAIKEGE